MFNPAVQSYVRLLGQERLRDVRYVTRIKDKNGETPLDLVPPEDTKLRSLFRKSQAQASIAQSDVANGEQRPPCSLSHATYATSAADDDDDEDGSGSGSGSDDE